MFKRIVSIFLFTTLFSVSALASETDLKAALQELQYTLTVEWNQQDETVLKAATDKFNAAIDNARTKGLSSRDIMLEAISGMPDSQVKIDTLKALSLGDLDEGQLIGILRRSQIEGASWSPKTVGAIVLGIPLTAYVVITIYLKVTYPESDVGWDWPWKFWQAIVNNR